MIRTKFSVARFFGRVLVMFVPSNGGYFMGRVNLAKVIPTGVFFLVLWLLQGQLSTLYEAVEANCGDTGCGEKIAIAYQVLSLSTLVSAGGIAWRSWRFNTGFHKGGKAS